MVAHWAAAVLYNGLGRYEDARGASREVVTATIFPLLTMWALFELVEACARVGDTRGAHGMHSTRSRRRLSLLAATLRSASRRAGGRF